MESIVANITVLSEFFLIVGKNECFSFKNIFLSQNSYAHGWIPYRAGGKLIAKLEDFKLDFLLNPSLWDLKGFSCEPDHKSCRESYTATQTLLFV